MDDAEATDLFRRAPGAFLDVGAGEVAHRQIGTGPAVLFVHGWPVSGATFRKLLPHLTDHVTCHVIDLPGAGDSRFDDDSPITFDQHIESIRRVVDLLALDDVAVVGHDSGGLLLRHALAGDPRVRSWGLLDTEQPQGLTWRFEQFLLARHLPGFGHVFAWLLGNRLARRTPLVLGGAFTDRSLLDGEFDELFLRPIVEDPRRRRAAVELLDSFERRRVRGSERSTAASTWRCSSCGVPTTRSSPPTGPRPWSTPSSTPASRSSPGPGSSHTRSGRPPWHVRSSRSSPVLVPADDRPASADAGHRHRQCGEVAGRGADEPERPAQRPTEDVEPLGHEAVQHEVAVTLPGHDAGRLEDLEVP